MNARWKPMRLVDAATLQRGFDLPTQERKPGSFPLVSSAGISDSHECSAAFGPGVVTGRSGSIGNVFYIEDDFWPLNTVLYVKDFHGNYPRFIYYLLQNFDLRRFASGSGVPTLNRNFVHDEIVHIPPLPEQQRIVAILDEAFEAIATAKANTEKNLQNARALFTSAFGTIASEPPHERWHRTTVAALAMPTKGAIRTGPFGSQLLHSEFVDSGIAVLGIDNAVANSFQWGKSRHITPEKYQSLRRYRVFPGDLLITIMGTCGRCAIVPDDIPEAINTKHLCCITLDRQKCIPEYLHAYFLHHPIAQDFLADQAKGSIMAGLNMEIIKSLPVILPPIGTQRAIVDRLSQVGMSVEALESNYTSKLSALMDLKQSLLHQAFTGNL